MLLCTLISDGVFYQVHGLTSEYRQDEERVAGTDWVQNKMSSHRYENY